jgi:RNA polymerase sigma factor (TIGR02999 family)
MSEAMDSNEITALLRAWSAGEEGALGSLMPIVHAELHRLARHYMRNERPGHTLQATALVNEAYLKLVDVRNVEWKHRAQFFAFAAQIMRNILVDAARKRSSGKRGGEYTKVDVEQAAVVSVAADAEVLQLEEALQAFEAIAPRQAKVVVLRYFGWLNEEEAAEALQTSARTVRRDWQFARAWLQHEMSRAAGQA